MRNSAILALLAGSVFAQTTNHRLDVEIPDGAQISVVSSGWGESRTSARGAALMIDLKTSLRLKNTGRLRIRGVSLEVRATGVATDLAAGGKASVSVPSLDVYPGQEFPVRVDLRLLQPGAANGQAAVKVQLDGLLYEDMSFFGPNRLNSRRTLTAWEMEARQDRQRLRQILARQGEDGLRREMLETLARDNQRPHLDVRVARGPSMLPGTLPNSQAVEIAFSRQPDGPVEGQRGEASKAGNEIRIPALTVESKTSREVRFIEYTLMARDAQGKLMAAGSLPATVRLKANESVTLRPNIALQILQMQGAPVDVTGLMGVLSQVEFADGGVWIAGRAGLVGAGVADAMPASLELQRLSDLYRKKSMTALVEELKRFD